MKTCELCKHWETSYYLSKSKNIGYCLAAESDETTTVSDGAPMYIEVTGRNFEAAASLVTRKDFYCNVYSKRSPRKAITYALSNSGLVFGIEEDESGISIRIDTDDNTAKQNYADALNDIVDIRACLLPLGVGIEVSEMTDHDTIIYNIVAEN